MKMSVHANIRSQQRAIPAIVVDLLLQFGASEKAGDGSSKLYFDKVARRRVMAYAGPLATALNQHLDSFAVVASDSTVITVGHRTERIRRDDLTRRTAFTRRNSPPNSISQKGQR